MNNYFLPKTAAERRAVKQKTTAMLSAKVWGGRGPVEFSKDFGGFLPMEKMGDCTTSMFDVDGI